MSASGVNVGVLHSKKIVHFLDKALRFILLRPTVKIYNVTFRISPPQKKKPIINADYSHKLSSFEHNWVRITWGRLINSRTAFFGVSSLSIIRATAVKTGIFTLYFWANAITAPAVDTPSATYETWTLRNHKTQFFTNIRSSNLSTWFIELRISSSFSPNPRRTPTILFLERFTKHVSMMSPVPDKPVMVVGFAPIFKNGLEENFVR